MSQYSDLFVKLFWGQPMIVKDWYFDKLDCTYDNI